MNNERLGDILIKQGVLGPAELNFCLSVQKNNGSHRLGQLLSHYNFVDEISIAKAVASQVGWSFFDGSYIGNKQLISQFGLHFLIEKRVFPLKSEEGSVFIISRINDTQTTDMIITKLGYRPSFMIGLEKSLDKALSILAKDQSNELVQTNSLADIENLNLWFDNCLKMAIEQSVSDIHIESSQKVIEIRFRIDGILIFIESLPLTFLSKLVNIIFHRAEVTISDFGHFHDAKFIHNFGERQIDVRVSHLPSVNGSSLVLRLLDKGKTAMKLSELGYGPRPWQLIEDNLIKPEGIVLVVGPTGCGKTTTLYAMLNSLKSIESKIVTVEDPIEIQLPLMTQIQINERKGISFPQTIRGFLRHDPDIILVGEIRDQQTAQEALRAAMTGHLVFSTLHTNRALDAILRLHDLGLPFVHLADHISMIIAQRLLRKLCPACKKIKKVHRRDVTKAQIKYLNDVEQEVYVAQGCPQCRNGFIGQIVVAEVFPINEAVGEFITKGDLLNLKKLFREGGYSTMTDEARRLIVEGLTSLEEAQRVLG